MKETKNQNKVTLKKGYIYMFKDGEDDIMARCSAWSGMEEIYFNDDLVSKKRNLGITSHHQFNVNNHNYKMTFQVKSLLRGCIVCTVNKDSNLIGSEEKTYYESNVGKLSWYLLLFLGLGIIVGYLAGYGAGVFLK